MSFQSSFETAYIYLEDIQNYLATKSTTSLLIGSLSIIFGVLM